MNKTNKTNGYNRIDEYHDESTDKMADGYREIINKLGEDPSREGLLKTPERAARAMQFLMQGYDQDPEEILRSALFTEDYSQMVIVKDIELYSM